MRFGFPDRRDVERYLTGDCPYRLRAQMAELYREYETVCKTRDALALENAKLVKVLSEARNLLR